MIKSNENPDPKDNSNINDLHSIEDLAVEFSDLKTTDNCLYASSETDT